MKKQFGLFFLLFASATIISCGNSGAGKSEPEDAANSVAQTDTTTNSDSLQVGKETFAKELQWQGITAKVSVVKDGEGNVLSISFPAGLSANNGVQDIEIDGTATNAEIGDLNDDGSPEVLVFTQSEGSGSYGNVYGVSVSDKKSVSVFHFPATADDAKISKGYMGHDKFSIEKNRLVQEFPVYKDGDINAKPTGGTRKIVYKLVDGDAGRAFEVDKVTNP
ncbi:MAG: hypothetical protein QM727_00320 [Niabella sp.]